MLRVRTSYWKRWWEVRIADRKLAERTNLDEWPWSNMGRCGLTFQKMEDSGKNGEDDKKKWEWYQSGTGRHKEALSSALARRMTRARQEQVVYERLCLSMALCWPMAKGREGIPSKGFQPLWGLDNCPPLLKGWPRSPLKGPFQFPTILRFCELSSQCSQSLTVASITSEFSRTLKNDWVVSITYYSFLFNRIFCSFYILSLALFAKWLY